MPYPYPESFHAVAWFEFFPKQKPLPLPAFEAYVRRRRPGVGQARIRMAFNELFHSGNPLPAASWKKHADFEALLRSREYRAAFYLHDIHVFQNPDDGDLDATFIEVPDSSYVGFTPIRYARLLGVYSAGRGNNTHVLKARSRHAVSLSQRIEFKLSHIVNTAQWLLTREFAPYAWMEVRYTFTSSAPPTCEVRGSSMPNQNFYLQLQRKADHSINSLDENEVGNFLSAGADKPAPSWSGSSKIL